MVFYDVCSLSTDFVLVYSHIFVVVYDVCSLFPITVVTFVVFYDVSDLSIDFVVYSDICSDFCSLL